LSHGGDQGGVMDAKERETLVRRSIDAWNSDDWEEGLRAIWDPEGRIVAPEGWPESGTFEGWSAMLDQWRRIKDSWATEQVEIEELRSVGDRVLADLRWKLRGEASGAPVEVEVAFVCEFRGARLVRMEYFLERDAARRAVEETR
jgi:ketosteroid isomerase-like protein